MKKRNLEIIRNLLNLPERGLHSQNNWTHLFAHGTLRKSDGACVS